MEFPDDIGHCANCSTLDYTGWDMHHLWCYSFKCDAVFTVIEEIHEPIVDWVWDIRQGHLATCGIMRATAVRLWVRPVPAGTGRVRVRRYGTGTTGILALIINFWLISWFSWSASKMSKTDSDSHDCDNEEQIIAVSDNDQICTAYAKKLLFPSFRSKFWQRRWIRRPRFPMVQKFLAIGEYLPCVRWPLTFWPWTLVVSKVK